MNWGKSFQDSDVIITGLHPWDTEIGSNCKDIAMELSKSNRVLYINRALDRIRLLKHRNDRIVQNRLYVIKGKEKAIKKVSERIWVMNPRVILESINFLPFGYLFNLLNKRNNFLMANEINYAISRLGFEDVILFNDNEFIRSFYIQDFIKHKLSIYYLRDYLTNQTYFRKQKKLETQLMQKSDFVLANSEFLAEYAKNYNKNSYFVGQGFDQSVFNHVVFNIPDDLKSLPKPTVGYVGMLTSERLDIKMIEHIAKGLREFSIVLIGPQDRNFQKSPLHDLSNIYFLGPKSSGDVPSYISGLDICINPQLINNLTIGNYPRKIDEYLILGKPVVVTKTKAMNYFKNFTYLSESYEEFVENILKAFKEDSFERQKNRKAFAKTHTWNNSIAIMRKVIQSNNQEG